MQCNTMQFNAMQCNAMQYNAMQCTLMQCNLMQFNAMQCNTMPSLERYLCTNLGQKKQVLLLQKNNHIGGLANILQSN